MIRLDKYLALSGERSRSEAGKSVRGGCVRVNGNVIKDPAMRINETDLVTFSGELIENQANQYIMLHKPTGVLTAARDKHAQTVMDLLPQALAKRKVLPVGRLDKDTTGLLLLTNDGVLAHRVLSPKSHVWKKYVATVEGMLDQEDVEAFAEGLQLSDFEAMPAVLTICSAGVESSIAEVEIREGKFHQVKRMFGSRGHEVIKLHRSTFGSLTLPDDLPVGEYRPLTDDELAALIGCSSATQLTEEGLVDG